MLKSLIGIIYTSWNENCIAFPLSTKPTCNLKMFRLKQKMSGWRVLVEETERHSFIYKAFQVVLERHLSHLPSKALLTKHGWEKTRSETQNGQSFALWFSEAASSCCRSSLCLSVWLAGWRERSPLHPLLSPSLMQPHLQSLENNEAWLKIIVLQIYITCFFKTLAILACL